MPKECYISLLKACHKRKTLSLAHLVHTHLVQQSIELSGLLGDYLVVTLAKCGAIDDALYTSQVLSSRTVYSWTAVIMACTEYDQHQDALEVYQCMLADGVKPDHFTFVSLFKACSGLLDLERGRKLHDDAHRKGYGSHDFVGNTIISMYGKCGSIVEAENAFCSITHRDVVSWNALLSGYIEQEEVVKALLLYRQMIEEKLEPNHTTYVIVLQACASLTSKEEAFTSELTCLKAMSFEVGQALHGDAKKNGCLSDLHVCNTLVYMYAECASLAETESIFITLPERDSVSWNALLSAYVEHGKEERALQLYTQMQVVTDEVTMMAALQACCSLADKEEAAGHSTKVMALGIGHSLHMDTLTKGSALDLMLGTTLVSFYGNCGAILEAESVFRGLPLRSVASWNAMLAAYVDQEEGGKALQLYRQMCEEDVHPDILSFTIALRACGPMGGVALETGRALHAEARRNCFTIDAFFHAALVYMYCKCSTAEESVKFFSWLSPLDSMSWTIMISACVEKGQLDLVLQLYVLLLKKHVQLTEAILLNILQACMEAASLEVCKCLHFAVVCSHLCSDLFLDASLIHAYGIFASMGDALAIFEGLPKPDVVAWNACLGGHAMQGGCIASLKRMEALLLADVRPNGETFATVFSACAHVGFTVEGLEYMTAMSHFYSINPKLKHFSIMVDLLGRAGSFSRLADFLRRMPVQPDFNLWLCVLGACHIHGNVELGKVAFDNAVDLNPADTAAYILMSNIYTNQECALEARGDENVFTETYVAV